MVAEACGEAGATFHVGGTYVCIEGPQFSTRAESGLYRSWGADVIGMTNLQEAKLAREAEIAYASLAMVTDYDCWHPAHDSVTVEMIVANLMQNARTAQQVIARAVEQLPIELVTAYWTPDGEFPDHEPNPLLPENRTFVIKKVLSEGAELGIAWDGDADRCFFVDDSGEYVPGDFVTAILGEAFARREPGAKIVYDVRATRAVADRVGAAGGVPLMNRVGHAFIKRRMAAEGAAVAAHPRERVRSDRHPTRPLVW